MMRDAIRAYVGYTWGNSTSPLVVGMRHMVERTERPVVVRYRDRADRVSFLYAGVAEGLRHGMSFIRDQMESTLQSEVRADARPSTWGEVADVSRRFPSDTDVVVLGACGRRVGDLARLGDVVAPMRIQYSVKVNGLSGSIRSRVTAEVRRRHQKRCRELGWRFETSVAKRDFDSFFHDMHVPTMVSRHGEKTRAESFGVAYHQIFLNGFVCFVVADGRRIGGAICRLDVDTRTLHMRSAGVWNGDERLYETGVYDSLYLGVIEWAEASGLERVDLSGSEPFISKGLFRFKRKFDPEVTIPLTSFRDKRLIIRARCRSETARNVMRACPVLGENGEGALRAVFFDGTEEHRKRYPWKTSNIAQAETVWL